MSPTITGPAPPGITSGSASASGIGGSQFIYYTVVTRYTSGIAFPQFTIRAAGTAGVKGLDAQHGVNVSWSPMPNATGYDVLRHSDPAIPASPCASCAVVLNTQATEITDTGQGNFAYPSAGLVAASNVSAQFLVDNTNSSPPTLNVQIGANEYQIVPPTGGGGSVTGGPFTAGNIVEGGGGQAIADSGVALSSVGNVTAGAGLISGNVVQGSGGEAVADSGVAVSSLATNPMSALGDTIYGGAAGVETPLSGNTTTVQKFLSQTGSGSASAAPSWQIAPSQGQFIYYFTDTASSIATYLQQTAGPFTPKTTLAFTGVTTGTATLQNWATNAGIPNIASIPAGSFEFHVHALKSAGSKAITLQCEFWEVSSVGVDIGLIGTSEVSTALTASEVEYRLYFVTANPYVMASTASRIVARVQAIGAAAGTNATVHIFVGGEADSHIALPSVTVDVTTFVPYTGAVSDLNLGTHTYVEPTITDFTNAQHDHSTAAKGGPIAGLATIYPVQSQGLRALAITLNMASIAGDVMVVVVGWTGGANTPASLSDTKTTYTNQVQTNNGSGGVSNLAIFTGVVPATPGTLTITATLPSGASYPGIQVIEFSPFTLSVDASGVANGTGAAIPLTTTQANDLIIVGCDGQTSNQVTSFPAGFTGLSTTANSADSGGIGYIVMPQAGKIVATAYNGSSGAFLAALALKTS